MNLSTSLSCLKSLKTPAKNIKTLSWDSMSLPETLRRVPLSSQRQVEDCLWRLTLQSLFLLCLSSNCCPIVPPLFVSLLIYSHHTHSSHKDFGCVFHTTTQRAASLRRLPGFLPHCGVLAHLPSSVPIRRLPSHPAMPSQQSQVPCFAFSFSTALTTILCTISFTDLFFHVFLCP